MFRCRGDLVALQSLVVNHSFSLWLKVQLLQLDPVSALGLSHVFYIHTRDTLIKKKRRKEKKKKTSALVEAGVRECSAKRHFTPTNFNVSI